MNLASTNNRPTTLAWPFWILQLTPAASNKDIEKAFNRILAKITMEIPGAEIYPSPEGDQTRDEFSLREARNLLQTPEKRALAEIWYISPQQATLEEESSIETPDLNWKQRLGIIK